MHRVIHRTVYTARKHSASVYESCVLPAKCDCAAALVFRVANGGGVKALSTSSVRDCEKKIDVRSKEDEKRKLKMSIQQKTATLVKGEAKGHTTQQPKDVKNEQVNTTPQQAEAAAAKSGKKKILEFLAGMRVDTVRKGKPKTLKFEQNSFPHQSNPEALKSTSMFQKTTMEASSQRVANGGGVKALSTPKDVKIKQVDTTPQQAKSAAAKSGKKKILEFLADVRVDTIRKERPKTLEFEQISFPNESKPELLKSTISMFQETTMEASSQRETLDPELVAAASAAASTLPHQNQALSELLKQLRQQQKGETSDLRVIISDIKVQKKPYQQTPLQSSEIHFDDDGRGFEGDTRWNSVLKTKRLNIFSPTTDGEGVEATVARPTLWDVNFARQLSESINQNPRNGFEEMIQWTKEGKMWQYPINNEAGLEEEANVSFSEHIFLEKHLEEGFPRQGPVRHFMELVVTGLSRNHYLTVQQKREHISWFRDYFHQKSEALKEVDVYLN